MNYKLHPWKKNLTMPKLLLYSKAIPRRNTNQRRFCTRTTHRLYFYNRWRRMGIYRLPCSHFPFPLFNNADYLSVRKTENKVQPSLRLLCSQRSLHPFLCKYSHGSRHFPNHWRATSVLFLWRFWALGLYNSPFYLPKNGCE